MTCSKSCLNNTLLATSNACTYVRTYTLYYDALSVFTDTVNNDRDILVLFHFPVRGTSSVLSPYDSL